MARYRVVKFKGDSFFYIVQEKYWFSGWRDVCWFTNIFDAIQRYRKLLGNYEVENVIIGDNEIKDFDKFIEENYFDPRN